MNSTGISDKYERKYNCDLIIQDGGNGRLMVSPMFRNAEFEPGNISFKGVYLKTNIPDGIQRQLAKDVEFAINKSNLGLEIEKNEQQDIIIKNGSNNSVLIEKAPHDIKRVLNPELTRFYGRIN